jgi:hypothetical protein
MMKHGTVDLKPLKTGFGCQDTIIFREEARNHNLRVFKKDKSYVNGIRRNVIKVTLK